MNRVVAPSRLHFGLFRVPTRESSPGDERVFGGVGLMIDRPGVIVSAVAAGAWQCEGMLASRAQQFALRYVASLPEPERRSFQVLVERCPREHTGLGVGTQLALAVGKAVAVALGRFPTGVELASVLGRGLRSSIGTHGFDRGGLLVDAGKRAGEAVAPIHAHAHLPDDWRVVVLTPPVVTPWHGPREQAAFDQTEPGPAERLRDLAEGVIIPAARRGDLDAFGEAVYEFNRKAGEPFTRLQGGIYTSPVVAGLIHELRHLGVRGVGQSSWGPTVFAVVADADKAAFLARRFGGRVPLTIARVSYGHRLENF